MRAGRLTEEICVERSVPTINDYGTASLSWRRVAIVRADRVDQSTTEFIRNFGATDEQLVIFRARFVEGVGNGDRVLWKGQPFNIKQVAPIGRREGLELRCVRIPDEGN